MDAILLRKMTMKSCLTEGNFAGVPIGQLIQLKKTRYLRYIYYKYSNIDFMQEVKDCISITPEFEIKKPGNDFEMHKKLNEIIDSKMTSFDIKKRNKKNKINAEIVWNNTVDKTSKGNLQAVNHGKK